MPSTKPATRSLRCRRSSNSAGRRTRYHLNPVTGWTIGADGRRSVRPAEGARMTRLTIIVGATFHDQSGEQRRSLRRSRSASARLRRRNRLPPSTPTCGPTAPAFPPAVERRATALPSTHRSAPRVTAQTVKVERLTYSSARSRRAPRRSVPSTSAGAGRVRTSRSRSATTGRTRRRCSTTCGARCRPRAPGSLTADETYALVAWLLAPQRDHR